MLFRSVVDNGVSRLVTDIDRTVSLLTVCRVRIAVRRGVSGDVAHARINDTPVHHVEQSVRPVRRGRYPLQRGMGSVPHQFPIQRDAHLERRRGRMRLRRFRRGAVFRFLAVKGHRGLRGKQKAQPFQGLGYCSRWDYFLTNPAAEIASLLQCKCCRIFLPPSTATSI